MKTAFRKLLVWGLLSLVFLPTTLTAQDKSLTPTVLRLYPAAAPTPALRYQLLPDLRDLRPGNAAVFYQRAHSPDWMRNLQQHASWPKMQEWLAAPYAGLPLKDVRAITGFESIFKELDRAARCEQCDWQLTSRLREDGVALSLPDIHGFRQFIEMLALKARVELHEGRYEQALRTLQTGFALSQHISENPILISSLVGLAGANMMANVLEEFVQQPNAPNLYWALRDLPTPFINLKRALQGDRVAVDSMMPEIREALSAAKFEPLSLTTLRRIVDRLAVYGAADVRPVSAAAVTITYPTAKEFFRSQGHTDEELEALPVTQVALMYGLAQWDRWFDAAYRWHNVPYWQARPGLKKTTQERTEAFRDNRPGLMFVQPFLPNYENILFARVRLDRRLAALQCVEAIRLYAAAHEGRLPDTLDDIRAVPLPNDPITGRAFDYTYRLDTRIARLSAGPPPGEPEADRNVLNYKIAIVTKTSP